MTIDIAFYVFVFFSLLLVVLLVWKKRRLAASVVLFVSAALAWYLWFYQTDEMLDISTDKKRNMPRDWSKDMFDDLVKECKEGVEDVDEQYADLVQVYCECSAEIVMDEMTYEEYKRYSSMTDREQDSIFRPLSEPCQHMVNQMMLDKLREEESSGKP